MIKMTQTTARIKQHGKHFEIIVDLDRALKFRKGESSNVDFLEIDKVFSDSKKGFVAPEKDVTEAFGTGDVNSIASKIVKSGEILTTQDFRDEERDKKIKQVVDALSKYAIDPKTGNPHTPSRIEAALKESRVNIKNIPIENQLRDIVAELSSVLPIKMEEKVFEIVVPAIYTGQTYGIISPYKVKEEWLNNGDLKVNVAVSGAILFAFFDKLNSVTHGAAVTKELKE